MSKLWARACLGVVVAVSLCLLVPVKASANVNDFIIKQFDAEYDLSAEDQQGLLRVRETIRVDFSDQNHGILRALPKKYKKQDLQLTIGDIARDGTKEQWTTYDSNGNTVLKIGNPSQTITGVHTYTITYSMHNVITFYNDHDELYWDINGDQWGQTAERVSVVVRLPGGVEQARDAICYTGIFGSTNQSCTAGYNGFTNVLFAETTRSLRAGETLSLVGALKKDYFYPPSWSERAAGMIGAIVRFAIPFGLLAGIAGRHWYRHGRDPRGKGVIVPHYEPPEGLGLMQAGTVADFRTDNRDISATIIDLAIRGYIKIIETIKPRKLLKDIKIYSLRLEQNDFAGLNDSEKTLLRGIFAKHTKGEEIDLGVLKYKLADTAAELRRIVKADLVRQGYLRKTPLSTTAGFVGKLGLALLASIILAVVAGGGAVILGIAAGTVLAAIFIIALPSRTERGVAAKESILGLKMYLEVAEKERIQKMQSPDAPYALKSKEPKKTVELFEKLLPYAMVLGVEAQWAKQFEHIYITPPDWYQGNWHTFSAVYLASALQGGVQAGVNTAFSSPSSSSGSGFSGGIAGGGGGGGGGGGW